MSNRHLKLNMSNTKPNPSSTTQNSAPLTNFLITVGECSIFPEDQTNNSMTSSFTLGKSQSL